MRQGCAALWDAARELGGVGSDSRASTLDRGEAVPPPLDMDAILVVVLMVVLAYAGSFEPQVFMTDLRCTVQAEGARVDTAH